MTRRVPRARSEPPVAPALPVFPRPVRTFVGRRADIERMLQHLDEEVLLLVYGVAGIGKTELVYQLVHEALGTERWREAAAVHLEIRAGATATRALAQLLELLGAPPEPRRGQPTERAHLGDQLAVLARLLDTRPYLLFIDDAHHLPAEEVGEALRYLARHVRRSRLVVASARAVPLRSDAPPPVVTTLGPLDAVAARQMMEALAERLQVAAPDPAALMRSTHGSPFHIRRLLAGGAAESGDSLEASLAELSPAARRTLLAVATAPQRPSVEALRSAWEPGASVDGPLRELEQRFLLDASQGQVVVHDLVCEALLAHATPEERARAYADCASIALASLRRGEPPALMHAIDAIALHIAAARHADAWSLVERWHSPLAAAGSDHLLLEPLEQLRRELPGQRVGIDLLIARCLVRASAIERADGVLSGLDAARSPAEDVRCWLLAGEIAQRRGQTSRAAELFGRVVEGAPDPGVRFQARMQIATVAAYRGEGERARAALDAALEEVAAPTPRQRGRVAWARTLSWMGDERFEQAADDAAAARRALPDVGHGDLGSRLAMLETLARIECEDMAGARSAARRIDETGLRRRVAALYRAFVSYADGEAQSAAAALLEMHERLSADGDNIHAYLAAYFGCAALEETGKLHEARALSERAGALAARTGMRALVARSLAQQALLAADALQCPLAHRLANEALESDHVGPRSRARAHLAHVHAFTIEGDVVTALEHVALARAAVVGLEAAHAAVDLEHAVVELVRGRHDAAIERAERVAAHFRDRSRHYETARTQLVLGAAYIARGRRTDVVLARRTIEQAREAADRAGYRSIQVGCAILSAALAKREDRARAADGLLAEALVQLDPQRGSLYAATLMAAIEGGASSWLAPGAVALLAHLGFRDAVDCYLVDRHGRRAATRRDVARERSARELFVDGLDGVIVARAGEIEIRGRPMQSALLSVLIEARGEAVSAETLYGRVWSVGQYHPLQHRNALYVAINRLRQSLRDPFPDREIVERVSLGWRLADGIDACVALAARDAPA